MVPACTSGTKLAFSRLELGEDGTAISFATYVMNADGTDRHKVSDLAAVEPVWSFDGVHLALSGDWVYVMNADGSDLHPVSDNGGCCAEWRP